jgi:hypothetical protein
VDSISHLTIQSYDELTRFIKEKGRAKPEKIEGASQKGISSYYDPYPKVRAARALKARFRG